MEASYLNCMRKLLQPLVVLLILVLAYLLLWPVPLNPQYFEPGENPGYTGPFERNDLMTSAAVFDLGTVGPEDVTKGPDGWLYTGVLDGRIFRCNPETGDSELYADTEGRPLGMQFDTLGNLYVADVGRGLIRITQEREIEVLVEEHDGRRLLFADDLDLASDGSIWYSDVSTDWGFEHQTELAIDANPTGRLFRYDPDTDINSLVLDDLFFANGVAFGPREEYVLINETLGARVRRLWLSGPKAGETDIFLEGVPGYVDNISFDGEHFWIALPLPRSEALEGLWTKSPRLRKIVYRIPEGIRPVQRPEDLGVVIGVDTLGQVTHCLMDQSGKFQEVTSVNNIDGVLYLGSIEMEGFGMLALTDIR